MLSKQTLKLLRGLQERKVRLREGLFMAEGPKLVGELLGAYELRLVLATEQWLGTMGAMLPEEAHREVITEGELRRASLLRTPQDVIALFRLPSYGGSLCEEAGKDLVLALDHVQDPGNVGTIIRLAAWFGIRHVFCSPGTADVFSPKALQATMGGIARVMVHQDVELPHELSLCRCEVYGTFLDGEDIRKASLSQTGVIVMGGEGQGIGGDITPMVTRRLFIPPYPSTASTVESLNVAMATAIVCQEFRRRGL